MSPLQRIIVGHDFRAGGETALKSAAVLARRSGAGLRLVHVVEPPHFYQRLSHPRGAPYRVEEMVEKAGERLQSLRESPELFQLAVEYEVRTGKPFSELIIARRAWQADLIVVGGTSRNEEPLLGSTSERVLRKAMVPVLVVRKTMNPEIKTFLVPVDFSSCARKAAEEALALAESFRGRIIFLHVVDLYPSYAISYTDDFGVSVPLPPPSPAELEAEWQDFLSGLPLEKVDWEKYAEENDPAAGILHQARLKHADLIVMGTHGRTGLEHMLLGSVAEKVVRGATDPVLTIRPDAFQFELP
ncbi:MAG TPA: universal stress protein [Candidatus Binatia bacterium]|jgi:nucleotide-binding universal stress UspA family protein